MCGAIKRSAVKCAAAGAILTLVHATPRYGMDPVVEKKGRWIALAITEPAQLLEQQVSFVA